MRLGLMHSWPEQRRFTGENLFFSPYSSIPDDDSLAAAVANTDPLTDAELQDAYAHRG